MLAWFGLGDTDEQVAIDPGNSEVSLQEGSAAAISDGEAVEVISVHESQGELADDEHPVSEYGKASSWGISSDGSPFIRAAVPSEDPPRRSVVPPLRLDKLNSFEVEPITSYSPTPEASAGLAGTFAGWFNTAEDVEVNLPGDTTKDDSLSGGSSETEAYGQEDRRGEGVGSEEGHDSREEHLREGELLGDDAENLGREEMGNDDRNSGEKFTGEEYPEGEGLVEDGQYQEGEELVEDGQYQEGEGLVEDGQYQEGEGLVEDGQYQEGEGLVEDGQYQEGEELVEDGQYQDGEEPVSFTTDDHGGSEIEVSSTVEDEHSDHVTLAESEAEAPAYESTATTQDWVPSLEAVGAAARKSLQRLSVMVSRDGASSEGDVDSYGEVELEDDDDEESDGSEATGFETDEEDEQRRGSQDDLRPDSLERQRSIEPLTSNGTSLVGREDVQQAPWEVEDAVLDEEVPSSSSNGASAMSGEEVVMTVDSSEQEAIMVDRRGDHPEDTVAATEHLKGMEIDNSREAARLADGDSAMKYQHGRAISGAPTERRSSPRGATVNSLATRNGEAAVDSENQGAGVTERLAGDSSYAAESVASSVVLPEEGDTSTRGEDHNDDGGLVVDDSGDLKSPLERGFNLEDTTQSELGRTEHLNNEVESKDTEQILMPFATSEGGITQVESARLSEARRSTENLRAAVLEGVYTHYAEKAGVEDEEFDPDEYVEMIEKGPGPSLAERRLVRYAFLNGYDDALLAVEKGELSGRSDRVREEVAAVYVDLHPREPSYGVPAACRFEPAGLLPIPQNLQLDDAPQCSIEKYDKVMSANQPPACDVEDRSSREYSRTSFLDVPVIIPLSRRRLKVRNHETRIRYL